MSRRGGSSFFEGMQSTAGWRTCPWTTSTAARMPTYGWLMSPSALSGARRPIRPRRSLTRSTFLHTCCSLTPPALDALLYATDAPLPVLPTLPHVPPTKPPTSRTHPSPHRHYTLAAAAPRRRGHRLLPTLAAGVFDTVVPRASSPPPQCCRNAVVAVAAAVAIMRPRRGDGMRAAQRVPARRPEARSRSRRAPPPRGSSAPRGGRGGPKAPEANARAAAPPANLAHPPIPPADVPPLPRSPRASSAPAAGAAAAGAKPFPPTPTTAGVVIPPL